MYTVRSVGKGVLKCIKQIHDSAGSSAICGKILIFYLTAILYGRNKCIVSPLTHEHALLADLMHSPLQWNV